MKSTCLGAEVIDLNPEAPEVLEYALKVEPTSHNSVRPLMVPALGLLITAPNPSLQLAPSHGDRFDFIIDITNSERVSVEMTSTLGVAGASSALSYTVYDARTGRFAIRLLWDRVAMMKNNVGVLIVHPLALSRLVSTLAREVYGRLPKLRKLPVPKVAAAKGLLGTDARLQSDLFRASAETISRIMTHSRFASLDPAVQRNFVDAKASEERWAEIWGSTPEARAFVGRSVSTSEARVDGSAKVFAFPSRCERIFREAAGP